MANYPRSPSRFVGNFSYFNCSLNYLYPLYSYLNLWNNLHNSALKCSVTARHILLPKSTEVVLALKQKIRNRVCDKERPIYIEDAFALAAEKYSQDYKTKGKGGLVGTLIRQGHYPCPKLDQAFYRLPLGEISGPIESSYGYHLVL